MIGDFTWTGWDYLGEAGVGRVTDADDPDGRRSSARPYPWLLAHVGDIDITGHRRPASYYREIVFGLRSDPYLAVLRPERHGRELLGDPVGVDATPSAAGAGPAPRAGRSPSRSTATPTRSSCCSTGASLGIAPAGEKNRFRAEFEVTYAPGELTAVARTGGAETGRFTLRSATGPVAAGRRRRPGRDPGRRHRPRLRRPHARRTPTARSSSASTAR